MKIKELADWMIWNIAGRTSRASLARKKGVKIGKGCEIFRDVNFGSEPYLIEIGDYVRITTGVKFCTHDGGMWTLRRMKDLKMEQADVFGRIRIGNNVHIGWDTTIMPGVEIGDNCVIGCGAVVTKSIPAGSIAAGCPARVIESIEQYAFKAKPRSVETAGMSHKEKKKFLQELL